MDAGTIANLITAVAADPGAVSAAIVLAALLAEDATAVIVGVLVSQAIISPAPALGALLAGTISGDVMLHAAGRYAGDSRWGRAILRRPGVGRALAALGTSAFWLVAAARFLPGARLPVYFGSGFLRMDWRRCLLLIAVTGFLWTPALFLASVMGGDAVRHLLDNDLWQAPVIAIFVSIAGLWAVRRRATHADERCHAASGTRPSP